MEIDSRVPGFLGRVLDAGDPVGTCFQVAPGVLVTVCHVLDGIGASVTGAVVNFDPLQGGAAHGAEVARRDPLHDLAVMVTDNPLPGCVVGLAASNDIREGPVSITGVGGPDDPGHVYEFWETPGTWAGNTTRDGVPLSMVNAQGLMKGMSGAPVLAGERVVGVVEGRYNSADGWGRDTVFVARTEDLDPLLVGLTDIGLPRRGWGADVVDALAGWLTARCGAVLADALGNEQQQAFREAVSRAIGRVAGSHAGELAANRRAFLATALDEHTNRLEGLRELPHLAAAVHALVNSHDKPSEPHLVAPPGLADALITEINLGVLDNARTGGPLALLAAEANFPELFALDEQLRAARETILVRLDSSADEVRARCAPITINTFTGRWGPLRADYLDPTDKRAVILQEGFTGRAWLVCEIDKFVRDHDRGYFIIQADAGTGKTAFALWYSGLDERPIHFTGFSKGARTTRSAVRNLAAQLIALLRLDEFTVAGHLPEMGDWSSWMHQVLTAAAKQRAKDAPGHPIVLVVDGLDEAEESDVDHLPFGLPDDLPPGIYVVATVRTRGLPHQPKPPMVVCDWNGQEAQAQQRRDLRAFITESMQLRLMTALHDDGLVPEEFVDALLDRCGDVWLYLHYVLEEITSGYRRPREVSSLPTGLEGYYHNTIERFCRRAKDERWRVPLLATLAIAIEPLNVETLVSFAGLDQHPRVARFLDGPLRPFCTVSRTTQTDTAGQPERFSLKHPSFAEYLAAGPGPDSDDLTGHQSEDVRSRRTRLAAECRAAGQRVCDRYLRAWGGLDEGLPDLAAEPSLAQRDGGYPLRALALHLFTTGRDEDLHTLLACGRQNRNVWYAAHESAGEPQRFLTDVALARRALDRTVDTRRGAPVSSGIVSQRVHYALVVSNVAAVSTTITPDLLEAIVNRGIWTPTRVLGTVGRMTDEDQRAQALLRIVEWIPEALVGDAWAIALALRGKHRWRAIAALIPHLPDDLLDGAVQAVADRAQESDVLVAAAALVDRLPEVRLNYFPWSAMPDMYYEKKMIVNSLVKLKRGYQGAADNVLDYLSSAVNNKFVRCQYLATLIPRLPAAAFDATMAVLAACPARYRSDALLALAQHTPVNRLSDLLHLAGEVDWEATPPEAEPYPWLRLMQIVGPRLSGPDQEASALAVAFALRVTRSAEAIEVLAPRLSPESARQALRDIEADLFRWRRTDGAQPLMIAVGALAKQLPPAEARAVVERYVRTYCHVDDDLRVVSPPRDGDESSFFRKAELLAPAAAYLPRETVHIAVRSICRGISPGAAFGFDLTPSLSRLAPTVAADPTLVQEAFDMVLKASAGWRPASRLTVLSVLAPHLDKDSLVKAIKLVLPGPVEDEFFATIAALGRELPDHQRTKVARRVLGTALEIASDTRRTRAIGALAPMLSEGVAGVVLELVGSVTHLVLFPHVLKALDNLAPQLPVTALPRALEIFIDTPTCEIRDTRRLFERLGRDDPTGAIRTLFQQWPQEDLRPKDSWVWALAPYLTESLAEEALDIAKALPVDYARRLSMAALAPRLPVGLRAAAAHEVLELLDVPPDDVDIRIAVLARLAAASTTDEVTAACQRLLSGPQPRDLSHDSLDALAELATHLPADLVEIVLGFSTRLLPDDRCRVIRTLAPRLPKQLVRDLVEALESVTVEGDNELKERARALIALATQVPNEDERHRILAAVLNQLVQRRWWNLLEPAFVELIPLLPPPSRSQAVPAAIRQCFDEYKLGDLGPLLSVLEGPELDIVFAEVDRVRDPHERATATAAVLRRAGELADQSVVFRDLDVFGGLPPACTRVEMFAIVGASAWWIHQQGGDQAVVATIDALFDVSRWWR